MTFNLKILVPLKALIQLFLDFESFITALAFKQIYEVKASGLLYLIG